MKVVWHFDNEEHKKEIEEIVQGLVVDNAIKKYPREISAAIKYADKGLINLG